LCGNLDLDLNPNRNPNPVITLNQDCVVHMSAERDESIRQLEIKMDQENQEKILQIQSKLELSQSNRNSGPDLPLDNATREAESGGKVGISVDASVSKLVQPYLKVS